MYLSPLSSRTDLTTKEPPWASVEDVSKHLGVSRDSVYRRIGIPTSHKIGRTWKFELSVFDDWGRVGGASGHAADEERKDER